MGQYTSRDRKALLIKLENHKTESGIPMALCFLNNRNTEETLRDWFKFELREIILAYTCEPLENDSDKMTTKDALTEYTRRNKSVDTKSFMYKLYNDYVKQLSDNNLFYNAR